MAPFFFCGASCCRCKFFIVRYFRIYNEKPYNLRSFMVACSLIAIEKALLRAQ